MTKQKSIKAEGKIVKCLPNAMFKVNLNLKGKERTIQAYTCGKMRQNNIRMVEGDKVEVELSPYDLEKGRIVERID